MTFNLAARQKPKDISPNWITACSSPSSHNFQLDSLTAARSAGSEPATAPLQFTLTEAGENMSPSPLNVPKKSFSDALFCKKRPSTGCVRWQSFLITEKHTVSLFISHIYTSNYFNAHAMNFISDNYAVILYFTTVKQVRQCSAQNGSRWAYKPLWWGLFIRLDSWTAAELGQNWVISNLLLWGHYIKQWQILQRKWGGIRVDIRVRPLKQPFRLFIHFNHWLGFFSPNCCRFSRLIHCSLVWYHRLILSHLSNQSIKCY